jgi:UDP-N-acetylglucosamine--N-acetylmuramyl-(pentapeptide) pyrophosphoryl-undecaprenol N-acetylglucosamine transferase
MGGSLGARQVNRMVEAAMPELSDDWYVVHQTGDRAAATRPNADLGAGRRYRRIGFIADGLGDLLAAATVVVCRAGANTLGEVALHGVPSILVPLPATQSRGEQGRNAEVFAAAGAARVLAGPEATAPALVASLRNLKDNPATLAAMGAAARRLATPSAAARIASLVAATIGAGRDT